MTNMIRFISHSPTCLLLPSWEFEMWVPPWPETTLADQTRDLRVPAITKLVFHRPWRRHSSCSADRWWRVSERAGGLCRCVATGGRPGCVAAARLVGRTGMPACSSSRSVAQSCTDTYNIILIYHPSTAINLQVKWARSIKHFKMIKL